MKNTLTPRQFDWLHIRCDVATAREREATRLRWFLRVGCPPRAYGD